MKKITTDDLYIYVYYDDKENSVSIGYASSIEEYEKQTKNIIVIGWLNVCGKEIEIRDFQINNTLEVVKKDE